MDIRVDVGASENGSLKHASWDHLACLLRHWTWANEAMATFDRQLATGCANQTQSNVTRMLADHVRQSAAQCHGPQFVREFRTIMSAIEADEQVRVAIFDSAVDGFFLNHSDFYADFADLKSIPQGPTGLEAWPDILVRLTRVPVVSIASIRGRPTGNGTELALACDMTFVSREKAVLSQWEVGVGNGAFGTRDYQVDAGLNSTQLLSAPIDTYVRTSRSTVQVNLRTWDSVCVSTRGRE